MAKLSHVFAASFDCGKVVGVTEKMICNDAKTSALDEKLQQAYRTAMASVSEPVDKKALAKEQRNWIQYTRANCQSAACLQKIYAARIAMLERNERNIQNNESYCVTPSGDKADVHDCSISAQDYRDPNDHVQSFNQSLVEKRKSGRIIECGRLVSLSNGNHIGPGVGEQTFGGYCVLQVAKQRQDVVVCKDDMVGDFHIKSVKPQGMSEKNLIQFSSKC
ncbi:lysozyme inhibitor LprI family protein [Xanthomonas sp. MUS 060]|uniref:lysozyme inhibitor LprI family protein n=1 Tax=Xanthomonas sp. MUS 060 TaxID=1588031 RepID=UPI001F2A6991|nr:lysozyme inhibitor LprI family protein [Xanthomonas sp. MUS 060]